MTLGRPLGAAALLGLTLGCSSALVVGTVAGEPCGSTRCEVGEVCCDASCGACVDPARSHCGPEACTDLGLREDQALPVDAAVQTGPPLDLATPDATADAAVDAAAGDRCATLSCDTGARCCLLCEDALCVDVTLPCPEPPTVADDFCPDCDPQDAEARGDCLLSLGFRWDGVACVALGGCTCEGADCEGLFATPADCERAYADCLDS